MGNAVCGGRVWSSADAYLDPCFLREVMGTVPLALLVVGAPFVYVWRVGRLGATKATGGWSYKPLDLFRLFITLALAVVPPVLYAVQDTRLHRPPPTDVWYNTAVTSAAALLAAILLHLEVVRHWPETPLLRLYWLLQLGLDLVNLKPATEDSYHRGSVTLHEAVVYTRACISFAGAFAVVLLNADRSGKHGGYNELTEALLADHAADEEAKVEHSPPPLPEIYGGLLNTWSFSWLNPVLATGYKRPLVHDDLYALHPKETADVLCARLEAAWAKERTRSKPSLARALFKTFGPTFFIGCIYKFIYDTLLFVGPQLLNRLINFLGSNQPMYKGGEYLLLLFLSAVASSITLHQYFHRSFRTGMRLKSAVISLVYKKALRIRPGQSRGPSEEKAEPDKKKSGKKAIPPTGAKSTGEIVNLMAVDAQRLQDLMSYFATLWSAPYQCALALYFLSQQLGVAIVGGVGVMLLSVPVSAFVAKQTRNIQRKVMEAKDERIKLTSEVFSGVKIIKLYAWERSFQDKIKRVRDREMGLLRKYILVNIAARFTWTIVPVAVSLASFAIYVLTGHELTAATAFTSIALFNILRFPLAMFPQMLSSTAEAVLSMERVRRFLDTPEVAPLPPVPPARPLGPPVSLRDVDLMWDENTPLLTNVTFECWPRSLTVVIGSTGAGKSGLLSALIGDLSPARGELKVQGSIAYVAQTAWIQNATLRDNILFGRPFEQGLYDRVLEACALLPDLAILPAGDQTEIGEKGINLSGGQKQRISLARAVYQQCDVYVLDDCLSAVDSQVARHILDNCILGMLSSKTVILATHNLHVLDKADQLILLENKTIAFKGSPRDFQLTGHTFAELAAGGVSSASSSASEDEQEDDEDSDSANRRDQLDEPLLDDLPPKSPHEQDGQANGDATRTPRSSSASNNKKPHHHKKKSGEGDSNNAGATNGAPATSKKFTGGTLVEKEGLGRGSVGWNIYWAYFAAAGGVLGFVLALLMLWTGQGLQMASNFWLSIWSDRHLPAGEGLEVYSVFCFVSAVMIVLTLLTFSLGGIRAARVFHEALLSRLLRAPQAFFDTTPTGRILNRFSKDTYTIDELLQPSIYMYMQCLTAVLGTIIVIATSVSGYFMLAVIPPFLVYVFAQRYYVPSSRELKRLDSVSRSPIFSHFGETLEGVSTIRAFRAQPMFIHDNEKRVDYNLQAYYIYIASNRWLAMRLEFVGACIVTLAGIFALAGKGTGVTAGQGGLSISYALSITQTLNWMVRMTSEVETNIVAVERVREYSEVEQEAPPVIEGRRPPPDWPTRGVVSIRDLSLAYRPGLPLVLKNISMEIKAGERVGIVGRTGAGKSSLLLALLRLVEPVSGDVVVDGISTKSMGLEDLRSHFSIIPQDPVLFTGTVRFNLDPFDRYTDEEVWTALHRAHLSSQIRRLPMGLSAEVEEGGKNFSLGERQLLCMARALLRHSKVLLLDEATSAVDAETDRLIQETIRTEFVGCTILTIAHRILTLVDYDRIAVLESGEVVEFDAPLTLLRKQGASHFRSLCEQAGDIEQVMEAFERGSIRGSGGDEI